MLRRQEQAAMTEAQKDSVVPLKVGDDCIGEQKQVVRQEQVAMTEVQKDSMVPLEGYTGE